MSTIITANDIKAAVDAAIGSKIVLTFTQIFLLVVISAVVGGVVAYFGSYLKKKGEDLATREDIAELTRKVEAVKIDYSRQIEDYKAELTRTMRSEKIAEFFAHWDSRTPNFEKLNLTVMEFALWLPSELCVMLAECICHPNAPGKPTPKDVLIAFRRHLLKKDAGDLKAEQIIYFPKPS
jgi:hypothetical protein